MSLVKADDGWMRFGSGRRWRMRAADRLVEVDEPGNVPSYARMQSTVAKVKHVKDFFRQVRGLGLLDALGTGVDVLVANSFTESLGTVPGPLEPGALRQVYASASGADEGARLHQVVLHVAQHAKYLERREPGYINPVATPGRVSLGCHHVLISTALSLTKAPHSGPGRITAIVDLVCRLPGDALYAAELAVRYFNRAQAVHLNQPPLLAVTYNAGSPRADSSNPWNLKQFGDHADRWVAYYNTSRGA